MTDPATEFDEGALAPLSDSDLERMALAATDVDLPDDAVAWSPTGRDPLIADWYMPAATASRRDWRTRAVVATVIASIVAINAAGLCVTYGRVVLG